MKLPAIELCISLLIAGCLGLYTGQQISQRSTGWHVLRFEDFPVAERFSGKPAAPIISTPAERNFRTVIRQGVLMGSGVWTGDDERDRPGPNFAGHFIFIRWGVALDGGVALIAYRQRLLMPKQGIFIRHLWAVRNPDISLCLSTR